VYTELLAVQVIILSINVLIYMLSV